MTNTEAIEAIRADYRAKVTTLAVLLQAWPVPAWDNRCDEGEARPRPRKRHR
jgi:hypothetical protein